MEGMLAGNLPFEGRVRAPDGPRRPLLLLHILVDSLLLVAAPLLEVMVDGGVHPKREADNQKRDPATQRIKNICLRGETRGKVTTANGPNFFSPRGTLPVLPLLPLLASLPL